MNGVFVLMPIINKEKNINSAIPKKDITDVIPEVYFNLIGISFELGNIIQKIKTITIGYSVKFIVDVVENSTMECSILIALLSEGALKKTQVILMNINVINIFSIFGSVN